MIVIRSIQEMQMQMKKYKHEKKTIGFVPTMGFLHEGHLRLVEQARKENEIVVLSIFVNPLQFGPNEDFDQYPRDFKRDEQLAKENGVDILFYPNQEEMYPKPLTVSVHVKERTDVLCGASREGHFDGVATVLTKLFHIVMCDRAYFGMKDAQQVAVVDGLIHDFNFPIELVPVETVREDDGLAKSSRNVNLTEKERKEAPLIYESLKEAELLIKKGEKDPAVIKNKILQMLSKTSGTIDYVDIYSYPQLKPITIIEGKVIIAIAIQFTKARLIDNITVTV